jgi:hypothetical protein
MMNQNRLNAVLARQKKGLVIDALVAAALVIAIGIAVVALWVGVPKLAPAYDSNAPVMQPRTPAAATAAMLEQTQDEACRAVQPSC